MRSLMSLRASDIMTRSVISLHAEQSVQEAARLLMDHGIQGAPVVDDQTTLVGVLSVTDLARYQEERDPDVISPPDYYRLFERGEDESIHWREGFHLEDFEDTTVMMVMTPSVISVGASDSIRTVVETMVELGVHRLVVADNHGHKLVGVITQSDVLARALLPAIKQADKA